MTALSALSDDDLRSLYAQANTASAVMPALIQQESSGRPGVLGPPTKYGQAQGMTQMLPATARKMADKLGVPWRPELMTATTPEGADYQRQLGEAYLREGLAATGNLDDALRYYHGGPDRAQWGAKTQDYVQRVAAKMDLASLPDDQLQALYQQSGGKPAAVDMAAPAPTIADMRSLADPKYAAARAKLQRQAATTQKVMGQGGANDFAQQVARSTGLADEINGAVTFLAQGGENLIRRAMGKPVAIPASTAAQAATDLDREQTAAYAQQHPVAAPLAAIAGIAASGRPAGVPAAMNPLRAGAISAGLQAPFALGRQEGSLPQRLPGAAMDTALAFGTGSALQGAANVLQRGAAAARAQPLSDARTLSNEGIRLTPGDMFGGIVKRVEDASTSIPVLGDAIRAAKIRGVQDFNRAALNRTLAPIGMRLGRDVTVGRDGLQLATDAISNTYNTALGGVRIAPDAQYAAELAALRNTPNLTAAQHETMNTIIGDVDGRFNGPISGDLWKTIDSDISKAVSAADNASATQPGGQMLSQALRRLQDAHFNLLARTNPQAAMGVQAADTATANLARVRQASQYTGSAARGGTFTPADLNRAVQGADTSAGNRAYATGRALMQDLTDPAMRALPSTVPDSGTPIRSLMAAIGGAGGAIAGGSAMGAGAVATPAALGIGGTVLAGAGLYSRPVQAALNAVYRAATPGAAREALGRLASLAARDPQLLPVYERLARQAGVPLPGASGQPVPQQVPQARTR